MRLELAETNVCPWQTDWGRRDHTSHIERSLLQTGHFVILVIEATSFDT